jgi:hypothetical protein
MTAKPGLPHWHYNLWIITDVFVPDGARDPGNFVSSYALCGGIRVKEKAIEVMRIYHAAQDRP